MEQDLVENRDRLASPHTAAQRAEAARDAQLGDLRKMIENKVRNPINPGNRKVLVLLTKERIRRSAAATREEFRNNAFADDVAKTNVTAILQQQGIENIRSL